MGTNYKHLYEQCKLMLEKYQDEIVPGFRAKIEELESRATEVVRCKDCKHCGFGISHPFCHIHRHTMSEYELDHFCSYGERRADNG